MSTVGRATQGRGTGSAERPWEQFQTGLTRRPRGRGNIWAKTRRQWGSDLRGRLSKEAKTSGGGVPNKRNRRSAWLDQSKRGVGKELRAGGSKRRALMASMRLLTFILCREEAPGKFQTEMWQGLPYFKGQILAFVLRIVHSGARAEARWRATVIQGSGGSSWASGL